MLILAYHRVNPEIRDGLSISPAMLRDQMANLLQRGWVNVLLEETIGSATPRFEEKTFALTFDDGYQDNYFHAAPVLEDLGLRATVYVVNSMIDSDKPFPWLQLGASDSHEPEDLHMTTDQLLDAKVRGVFEYGSHTLTHPLLSTLTSEEAWREISESKTALESRLGDPVTTFCYPAGDFRDETVAMVREAGYRAAVVTPNRLIPETMFTLHRVGVYSHITPLLFRIKTHPVFARAQHRPAFWRLRQAMRRVRVV